VASVSTELTTHHVTHDHHEHPDHPEPGEDFAPGKLATPTRWPASTRAT
jgi:hypothetical protein